jgi:NADH:ubiquinone oxidoreductase subunit F (NADH-binding)
MINKIKEAGLVGRGGGGFSTGEKWEIVKNDPRKEKYVICNGAEGELGVFKDKYILENHLEEVVNGVSLAMKEMDAIKGYIYLRGDYYDLFEERLKKIINDNIEIYRKPDVGYIGGEETVVCEIIEGNSAIPRIKPPYLAESGLFGSPTLINNVETFYWISKISKDEYSQKRFYSLSGAMKNLGVFEFGENETIKDILVKTDNLPEFDFFVQAGGGASGIILLPSELDRKVEGIGSIIVFEKEKTDYFGLMEKWSDFFHNGNCDKCTPCREGMYKINEMIRNREIDYDRLEEIFLSLEKSSFCPLGRGIIRPLKSFIEKIFKYEKNSN